MSHRYLLYTLSARNSKQIRRVYIRSAIAFIRRYYISLSLDISCIYRCIHIHIHIIHLHASCEINVYHLFLRHNFSFSLSLRVLVYTLIAHAATVTLTVTVRLDTFMGTSIGRLQLIVVIL